jgi:hypothetical protein
LVNTVPILAKVAPGHPWNKPGFMAQSIEMKANPGVVAPAHPSGVGHVGARAGRPPGVIGVRTQLFAEKSGKQLGSDPDCSQAARALSASVMKESA